MAGSLPAAGIDGIQCVTKCEALFVAEKQRKGHEERDVAASKMEGLKLSVVNKFQRYLTPDRGSRYATGADSDGGGGGDDDDDVAEGAAAAERETNFRQRLFEKISPYKQVSTRDDDFCLRMGRGGGGGAARLRTRRCTCTSSVSCLRHSY